MFIKFPNFALLKLSNVIFRSKFCLIFSILLSLIAVGDEVGALLSVGRRDLSAVGEEADEAAAEEAEPADEVPAEGPLELGEATVKAVSSIQRGSG